MVLCPASSRSTPHFLAAACSSIERTAAPICRIGWMWWRMLREPSVSWLPYFGSSPGAWTIFTRAQSASISSASTIGTLVRAPVPISERWATMVTVPSGSIETNTWIGDDAVRHVEAAGVVRLERACGPEGQELHGDDQADPEAVPLRNARRLTFSMRTRPPMTMGARAVAR